MQWSLTEKLSQYNGIDLSVFGSINRTINKVYNKLISV